MKKRQLLHVLAFVLLSLPTCFGQGVFIPPQTAFRTVNGVTAPIANATVTVCAAGASGIPCSPALVNTIFKDAALTQPLSNPFTSDSNGNYQFAVAPGTYTVTTTAAGFSGYSYQVTLTGGAGSILFQTNSVNNGSQSKLNLKNGSNISITDDGSGGITINSSASGSGITCSGTCTSGSLLVFTGSSSAANSFLANISGPPAGVSYSLGSGQSWQVTANGIGFNSGVQGSSNVVIANTFQPASSNNAGGMVIEGAPATGSACAGSAELLGNSTSGGTDNNGASVTAQGGCANGFGATGSDVVINAGSTSHSNSGGNIRLNPGTGGFGNGSIIMKQLVDASGATQLKLPVAAAFAALANGECGYDSTNNNLHCWINGADHIMLPLAVGFASGDCGAPTNSGGTWFVADAGSPCGSGGGGGITLQTNSGNNTSQVLLNFTPTSGAGGITPSNPSGGVEQFTLNNTTTTVNGQSCALAGTCTIPFQTGGINNTSTGGLNFITSTVNVTGLVATHSNPGTNQEKVEISGTTNATSGGTGINTSASTGVPQIGAGTWSVSTALANGTTATTQSLGDSTNDIATDHFVLLNSLTNCMTNAGDMIVGGASGICARLAVNSSTVPEVPVSVSGGTSFQPAGILVNPQSGTSYTIAATDRAGLVIPGNASPVAITLPQAGTTGFASNFPFGICNSGAGTATVTPTTSVVNIFSLTTYSPAQTSESLSTGQCSFWYSDNANYDSILFGANSGGLNVNMSNATATSLNVTLNPQANVALGSTTKAFTNIFWGNATFGGGNYFELTGTPTGARILTPPDATTTLAGLSVAETFSALQTFGTNISIGGVTATGATGTGNVVFSASPTLTGTITGAAETLSGLLTTAASAAGGAGFNLPHGAAPTSPNNGDVWTTTSGLFVRINGATVGPLGGGVTSVSNSDSTLTISPTTGAVVASLNLGHANTWTATQTFGTNISIGNINLGTPTAITLTNASSLPCSALPALTGNVTTSAGNCSTTVAAVPASAVPAVTVTVGTSSPVTVSTTLNSAFYYNQDATAATAITYNLPTAAAGKQFCFANSNNGSAANTGVLTIATSATGQFIIFTDGTLSATGGNVTSGGAAADAACVVGVDATHWQLYTQVGTWTKH